MTSEQLGTRAAWYRGGASKALFVRESDLPSTVLPLMFRHAELDLWVEAVYGSGHRREIDGIGGGEARQSKLAIIDWPSRPDADIDYTFAQVLVEPCGVSRRLTCGDIIAAVGPYGIDEGLIPALEPVTRVRIHNRNSGRIVHADVQVKDGRARVQGDQHVDGVPGTGAPILLDWRELAGTSTGRLLPTGHVRDRVQVDGLGPLDVSIVDLAVLVCYVRAGDVGLPALASPSPLPPAAATIDRLEQIRRGVATSLGISSGSERAELSSDPVLALVAPPADWSDAAAERTRCADECSFIACMPMVDGHRLQTAGAYASIAFANAAAAAVLPGTVVNEAARTEDVRAGRLRIGHPGGVVQAEAEIARNADRWEVQRALYASTARRIMDGTIYVPLDRML